MGVDDDNNCLTATSTAASTNTAAMVGVRVLTALPSLTIVVCVVTGYEWISKRTVHVRRFRGLCNSSNETTEGMPISVHRTRHHANAIHTFDTRSVVDVLAWCDCCRSPQSSAFCRTTLTTPPANTTQHRCVFEDLIASAVASALASLHLKRKC